MKTQGLVIAALLLMGLQTADAQKYFSDYNSHSRTNLDRAVKYYLVSLESDNEGVIESGLAHLARMKMYFPERVFGRLEEKVTEIATAGPTPRVRYEAYLVSMLLRSPETFRAESRREYEGPEALFTAIAERMNSSILGARVSNVE